VASKVSERDVHGLEVHFAGSYIAARGRNPVLIPSELAAWCRILLPVVALLDAVLP